MSLLFAFALLALASASICVGTASVPDCTTLHWPQCAHSYTFSGAVTQTCTLGINNGCRNYATTCTPLCNGTTLTSNCAGVNVFLCNGYYSTDSNGPFSCAVNTATNTCGPPPVKHYCSPTGTVTCSANAYSPSIGCGSATTQADCTSRYILDGWQKNQCQWDIQYNVCYLGVPCHF